jgi:hypothetical protein
VVLSVRWITPKPGHPDAGAGTLARLGARLCRCRPVSMRVFIAEIFGSAVRAESQGSEVISTLQAVGSARADATNINA